MELKDAPGVAIVFALLAAILIVGFIVVDEMTKDDNIRCPTTGYSYNETAGKCDLDTNASKQLDASYAFQSTTKTSEGMYNVVEFAPTWGVMIGVAILLAITLAAFFLGRKYMKNE